jgi:GLPGLI family protein
MGINTNNAMKKFLIVLLSAVSFSTFAQKNSGTINYDFETDWLKMVEKNKFLSNEERQRALQTWKNDETYKVNMQLAFNPQGSYYGSDPNERGDSWQKTEYWVRRDFTTNTVLETQMIGGKVIIVEDSLYSFPWKIKSEIKEVAGYLCIKATVYDSTRNYDIEAWFTTDIPMSIGPEEFMGLPGAILEMTINEGVVKITATSVKLNKEQQLPALPKKIKGKRFTKEQYTAEVAKYVKDSAERRQMAYGLRY